jgi:Zn-dependent peptidase ImmA (M78 family)/DNA-binding XRE family transcriptional regulator
MSSPLDDAVVGERIKRMRDLLGVDQKALAAGAGIASGRLSLIENGRASCPPDVLPRLARLLECRVEFFTASARDVVLTPPRLRAYADAPQRVIDRQIADVHNLAEVINAAGLRRVKAAALPEFLGDLDNPQDIEDFADYVRATAGLDSAQVVGNATRTVEKLGVVVIPMRHELGPRHMGMSMYFDSTPVICVSRSSADPDRHVPGDRQRFTVAHELGHVTLHAGVGAPGTPQDSRQLETQAHRFAAAFLAPADAIVEDLDELGRGRVTLRTLQALKARWGISIKALVGRFRDLGVIDQDQAVSLYKQISARGWTKAEPVPAGNEDAIWLKRALEKHGQGDLKAGIEAASAASGLLPHHVRRWLDWTPVPVEDESASILQFPGGDRGDDSPSARSGGRRRSASAAATRRVDLVIVDNGP